MNLLLFYTKNVSKIFFPATDKTTTKTTLLRGHQAMGIPLIGGSCKVMLVVAFGFLPQNFGRFQGPMNNTLSFYE